MITIETTSSSCPGFKTSQPFWTGLPGQLIPMAGLALAILGCGVPAFGAADATDIKWGGPLSGPPSGVSLTQDGTLLVEVSSSASRSHPRDDRRILAIRDEGVNGRVVAESYLYGDMGLRALTVAPNGAAFGGTVANNSPFLGLYAVRYRPGLDLEELWSYDNQGYGNLPTTLALGPEGELYAVAGKRVMRLDAGSGALVEQRSISRDNPDCAPIVSRDGILFYSDGLHYFSAARLPGERLWSRYVDHEIHASPAIGGDERIYVCSRRQVLTFDPHSGDQSLLFDPPEFNSFQVVGSSPAIGPDNTLYVGSLDGYLYAIDALSGSLKARYAAGSDIRAAPAIAADGTVYFGTVGGYFCAVRLQGDHFVEVANQSHLGDSVDGDPVIAPDGTVYVTTRQGNTKPGSLYALIGTGSGPARSAWPTYHQNAQRTGLQPTPPHITAIHVDPGTEVTAGVTVTLTAVLTGTSPLDLQWFRGSQRIAAASEASLVVEGFSVDDAGTYRLSAINDAGGVSASVVVTVADRPIPPEITSGPVGGIWPLGEEMTLQVAATGTSLKYQWSRDGESIAGATGPVFHVAAVAATDAGSYQVSISNAAGSVRSGVIPVTVFGFAYTAVISVAGPEGETVNIDFARDLHEQGLWQGWTNVVTTGTLQHLIDWASRQEGRRFYRLRRD